MYLYLSKTDALHTYRDSFIINIPGGIHILGEIGLCDIHFKFNTEEVECFDIWCDLCDTSIVGSYTAPILRRIHTDRRRDHMTFDPIFYVPVIKAWTDRVQLYIKPVTRHSSSVELQTLNCTLHIREK
jgi:hypothetical protein